MANVESHGPLQQAAIQETAKLTIENPTVSSKTEKNPGPQTQTLSVTETIPQHCVGKPDNFLGEFCVDTKIHDLPYTNRPVFNWETFLVVWLLGAFLIRLAVRGILHRLEYPETKEKDKLDDSVVSRHDTVGALSDDEKKERDRELRVWRSEQKLKKQQAKAQRKKERRQLSAEVNLVTFWAAMFLTVCYIWGSTVWLSVTVDNHSGMEMVVRVLFAVITVPSILLLEAVAMAQITLEDKDVPEQIEDHDTKQAHRLWDVYTKNPEAYLRAREWLLALLTVILTVVIEFEKYFIPGLGTYQGVLARTLITAVLASIAVIWIAQAPGKGVGKERPIRLLNFPFGPSAMNRLLLWLVDKIKKTSIDRPSDAVSYLLNGLVQGPEPALGPGGPRLFAEVMKRYGGGFSFASEVYLLNDDGSGILECYEEVYIGRGQTTTKGSVTGSTGTVMMSATPSHTRYIFSDVELAEKPVIEDPEAHIIQALGESLTEDMRQWKKNKYIDTVPNKYIECDVSWKPGDKTAVITFALPDRWLKKEQAFLLRVRIKAKLNPGTFKTALSPGKDHWERRLIKPCFQASTIITLNSKVGRGLFDEIEFFVTQDDHGQSRSYYEETVRFEKENTERVAEKGAPSTREGVSADGRSLTIKLSEGLPGATYRVKWEMKNA